jgi:UDP-N-acetylglucosamine 1-carboxyvinyltransferase
MATIDDVSRAVPQRATAFLIRGGVPLVGAYRISGAKNAVLPLMAAAMLGPAPLTLRNVPHILDVEVLAALLRQLGAEVEVEDGAHPSLTIAANEVLPGPIDRGLVSRMRASVLLLGALLTRFGEADLPLPGGDAIGLRSLDFHLGGLRAMGAAVRLDGGVIRASAPRGLRGAEILLPQPSVGATENLLLAAVLANGRTVIRNAAREPEVADLGNCLNAMGASIAGIGSDTMTVDGRRALGAAEYHVMPDRIELGTITCAAAITDGDIFLEYGRLDMLGAAVHVLQEAGVELRQTSNGLKIRRSATRLTGTDVQTAPFPGFATDLQAPVMALLTIADGASMVRESVFEHRFQHVGELRKMGANIKIFGRTALIRGVQQLRGAVVTGSDVRAAGALVIAGLGAEGETRVDGLEHLHRGYDAMAEKLAACGARINCVTEL